MTVIVRIASEALRERVAKHDTYGVFLLKKTGGAFSLSRVNSQELSFLNPRADLLSFAGLDCRSHAFLSIVRTARRSLLRLRSRAKGSSAHLIKMSWHIEPLNRTQRQGIEHRGLGSGPFQFPLRVKTNEVTFSPEHSRAFVQLSTLWLRRARRSWNVVPVALHRVTGG